MPFLHPNTYTHYTLPWLAELTHVQSSMCLYVLGHGMCIYVSMNVD
jgi:hypothetical protein